MSTIPSVNFLAQNKLVPLPVNQNNTFEFIFSSPFTKGSPTWKATPKELQHHALPGPIPEEKPIFRDGITGATLSYGRLRSDALKVASSLVLGPLDLKPAPVTDSNPAVNRGAVVSPIVLLHLPNCLQFAVLAFGVLASGLTFTAANPVLTPSEIAHILTLSQPSVLVTTPAGLPNFQAAFALLPAPLQQKLGYATKGNVFLVDLEHDDYGASAGSLATPPDVAVGGWKVQNWKVLLPAKPAPFSPPKYVGSEAALRAAVIFWSSGTSGKSKGVILTHKACSSAIISVWHYATLGADERLVGLPPFYHIFDESILLLFLAMTLELTCFPAPPRWANVLMVSPAFGATTTTIPKFDPQTYLRIAQDTRATHLHIAPPVAVLFAKSPLVKGFDLSSVKACTSGGAPLGASVISETYKRLGILVRMGYGLSETSGVTGQVANSWAELEPLLGSTGSVFGGTEIKIVSIEDGKTVQVEQTGEICIRSNYTAISYLNNPEATSESFDDEGWFHTGDVGKFDAKGNLYIVDRLKEILKIKGFQVAPADLEDALCGSPLVQDAGVSSIYHEEHATEYPRAYVVPFDKEVLKGGPAAEEFAHALRKHIEAKHAPYKWIRGGFVIVEAVPKSPAGKILRRLLKDTKGHLVHVYEEKIRAKL